MQNEENNEIEMTESAGSTGLLGDDDVAGEADFASDNSGEGIDSFEQEDDGAASSADESEFQAVDERSFDPLFSDIDDQELATDDFYGNITEQDIKELPTVARRMLHNFRVAYKQKQNELESSHASRQEQYQKREQQIQSLERDFARRQAEFASVIDDPRIKEALKTPSANQPRHRRSSVQRICANARSIGATPARACVLGFFGCTPRNEGRWIQEGGR